ncbi:MAG: hypothetical protein R3F02_22025 [Thiolinea sp.]
MNVFNTPVFLALSLTFVGQVSDAADITFKDPLINGFPVDKCVAGSGWGDPTDLFNPLNRERCGEDSQHHVATAFCQQQGHSGVADQADAWDISLNWPRTHAIWMHEKDADPLAGEWGSLTGGHHFSYIICSGVQEDDFESGQAASQVSIDQP